MENYLLKNTVIGSFINQFNQNYIWKVAKYTMIIGIEQILTNDINNYKQLKYHAYSVLKTRMQHLNTNNIQYTDISTPQHINKPVLNNHHQYQLTNLDTNTQQSVCSLALKNEIQKIKDQLCQLTQQFNQSEIRRSLSQGNHRPLTINDLANDRSSFRNQSHINSVITNNNNNNNNNSQMTNSFMTNSFMNHSYNNNQRYKTIKRNIMNNADQFLKSKKLNQIKTRYDIGSKQQKQQQHQKQHQNNH